MGTRTGNPTWEDSPSTNTLITAARLNAIEEALDASGGGSQLPFQPPTNRLYSFGAIDLYSTSSLGPDVIDITPYLLVASTKVAELAVNVKTVASASTLIELGLYSGTTGELLASAGTIDIATDGVKRATLTTAVTLPAGLVFCAARLRSTSMNGGGLMGMLVNLGPTQSLAPAGDPWNPVELKACGFRIASAGTTALPSTIAGATMTYCQISTAFGYIPGAY